MKIFNMRIISIKELIDDIKSGRLWEDFKKCFKLSTYKTW
jgi:hypothetical protein